jgi:hypothetical protein
VVLSDGRTIIVREPEASEYLRVTSISLTIAMLRKGLEVGKDEEDGVRRIMALLSGLSFEDVSALSYGDYARLLLGVLGIVGEAMEDAPLVTPTPTDSSPTKAD